MSRLLEQNCVVKNCIKFGKTARSVAWLRVIQVFLSGVNCFEMKKVTCGGKWTTVGTPPIHSAKWECGNKRKNHTARALCGASSVGCLLPHFSQLAEQMWTTNKPTFLSVVRMPLLWHKLPEPYCHGLPKQMWLPQPVLWLAKLLKMLCSCWKGILFKIIEVELSMYKKKIGQTLYMWVIHVWWSISIFALGAWQLAHSWKRSLSAAHWNIWRKQMVFWTLIMCFWRRTWLAR